MRKFWSIFLYDLALSFFSDFISVTFILKLGLVLCDIATIAVFL